MIMKEGHTFPSALSTRVTLLTQKDYDEDLKECTVDLVIKMIRKGYKIVMTLENSLDAILAETALKAIKHYNKGGIICVMSCVYPYKVPFHYADLFNAIAECPRGFLLYPYSQGTLKHTSYQSKYENKDTNYDRIPLIKSTSKLVVELSNTVCFVSKTARLDVKLNNSGYYARDLNRNIFCYFRKGQYTEYLMPVKTPYKTPVLYSINEVLSNLLS